MHAAARCRSVRIRPSQAKAIGNPQQKRMPARRLLGVRRRGPRSHWLHPPRKFRSSALVSTAQSLSQPPWWASQPRFDSNKGKWAQWQTASFPAGWSRTRAHLLQFCSTAPRVKFDSASSEGQCRNLVRLRGSRAGAAPNRADIRVVSPLRKSVTQVGLNQALEVCRVSSPSWRRDKPA